MRRAAGSYAGGGCGRQLDLALAELAVARCARTGLKLSHLRGDRRPIEERGGGGALRSCGALRCVHSTGKPSYEWVRRVAGREHFSVAGDGRASGAEREVRRVLGQLAGLLLRRDRHGATHLLHISRAVQEAKVVLR